MSSIPRTSPFLVTQRVVKEEALKDLLKEAEKNDTQALKLAEECLKMKDPVEAQEKFDREAPQSDPLFSKINDLYLRGKGLNKDFDELNLTASQKDGAQITEYSNRISKLQTEDNSILMIYANSLRCLHKQILSNTQGKRALVQKFVKLCSDLGAMKQTPKLFSPQSYQLLIDNTGLHSVQWQEKNMASIVAKELFSNLWHPPK